MAVIERHAEVADYIVEMTLPEIRNRGGVADIVEDGNIVIIKDFRLRFDFAALEQLAKSTDQIADPDIRWRIKKLEAPQFFEGGSSRGWFGRRRSSDTLREALLETLCEGSTRKFDRAAKALRHAHDEALRIFEICFAGYSSYRFVPSIRLTRTLFENLHWDDHSIDDDFHQARVFANLDSRPRIWHVSHRIPEIMRSLYREHDLGRFAGKDPNEMLFYINSEVLGGQRQAWKDHLPRHKIAFDPGEVWLGESRLVSHQIYYGEAALVYMWFVRPNSMVDPDKRFNSIVERIHEEFGNAAGSESHEPAQRESSATSSHSTSINRSASAR
jgi:hypothetical protein